MNVGSGKYHSYGPNCSYKGKKVPCLIKFSEGWVYQGIFSTKVLRHLDDFKLYDNDRKNGIIPAFFLMEMVVVLIWGF